MTMPFAALHESAIDVAHRVSASCFALCSILENPGPSRPAPRDGSGAKDRSLQRSRAFTRR